jgi:hypothetical protein
MGDPGVEEGMGYERLPRRGLIVVGKLFLSLLHDGVGRSVVCFMVLGSVNVNVDVVIGDESEGNKQGKRRIQRIVSVFAKRQ